MTFAAPSGGFALEPGGVAGAFIGGLILSVFMRGTAGFLGSIVVAFLGAALLLAILQALGGRRL